MTKNLFLTFATSNEHKLSELRAILPQYKIYGLADIDIYEEIPETGKTLQENALIKAQFLFDKLKSASLSEDTGLEVFALDGAPGVHTARYAGEERDPIRNMNKLLSALEGCENRQAQFRTVIAMVEENNVRYFEGIIKGKIADRITGNEGFGYDPIFIPDGYEKTFAELPYSIKNKISHRARAVASLISFLTQQSNQ